MFSHSDQRSFSQSLKAISGVSHRDAVPSFTGDMERIPDA
jgi:hypothetical protein